MRRVRVDEADELRRVRLAMLLDTPDAFASRHADEAAQPDEFWQERAAIAAQSSQVATFQVVDGDRHVGSATCLRLDPARAADLVAMWVDPEWRRRGIGQRLVEGVCRWAARQGSASIELDVRELNTAALDLYRRCGFEVVAWPHPAEAAPDLMELRMRRWLDVPPAGPVVMRLRRQGALVDQLEELPASDLRSLLLHVTRRRAAGLHPAAVLQARRDDPTLAPVAVDGRALQMAGMLAMDAATGFEPVTLSPVAPAGVNTVLGGLDQTLSLATVRVGEVLADPTTSMALEVALRRRAGEASVRLCWVGRVLRMQRFGGGWNQHFGLFGLVSAGRRQPDHGFGLAALHEHIAAHLGVIAALAAAGHDAGRPVVEVSDTALLRALCRDAQADLDDLADQARDDDRDPEQLLAESGVTVERFAERVEGARLLELVRERVYAPLRGQFPDARLGFRVGRLAGIGYYNGLLLNIDAERDGRRLSVADGGSTDWTQRLLSDRAERLFTSGIGLERLIRLSSCGRLP